MLEDSHKKFGTLPWADLFAPAIALADKGFYISPRLHTLLVKMPKVAVNPEIKRYFFDRSGKPKAIGTRLKNPAYAATLKKIARHGSAVFYKGEIAKKIVNAVASDPNRAGQLSAIDLANYQAKQRPPVCATFRVYKICGAPPPSSGGTTVIAILKMIEAAEAKGANSNDVDFYHTFIEASRLAFADRNTYVADPDFVDVPTLGLVDSAYLSQRAKLIDPKKRAISVEAGSPPAAPKHAMSNSPELPSTSHFSIVDAAGMFLSMTTSIEAAFGSRVFVGGFLLNNQLTDFPHLPRRTATAARLRVAYRRVNDHARRCRPSLCLKTTSPFWPLARPAAQELSITEAGSLYRILAEGDDIATAISAEHVIAMGDTTGARNRPVY